MPTLAPNAETTPSNIPKPLTTPPGSTLSPSLSPTASPTLSASDSGEVPPSTSIPSMTLEEKVQQLNQTLSLLQSERDSLAVSLKTTRRDAQRADAAIRADIETLKRASDKFASVEQRARQKVLALQETVKQTLVAAEGISASVTDVETSLPALREQQAGAEKEYKVAKQQAAQAREERDTLERQEKKRIDSLQTELAGLGSKLEKLNCKREKLENSVIPELEEELRRIEEEIAAAAGSPPPTTDHLDAYYRDPAFTGASYQSGSSSALPSLGGFPDDSRSTSQDSLPGPIENLRRKHLSHPPLTPKRQQPQTQKPVQILRPPHQPRQVRPTLIGNKSTTASSTSPSTLSSLATPFEPSPKRQAQLQNTLGTSLNSSNITSAFKAELNPTSNVFAPRVGFTTSSTSSTSVSTSTSQKSSGAISNISTPGRSAWSRSNQKSRRSDVDTH
jgi:vacuolar-type H+-ATPase subunit D/Vma8